MRVLVVTIVHHPLDARIYHRQIGALLEAAVEVTYAAPWSSVGVQPPGGLRSLDLPRVAGRRRVAAVRAARSLIRKEGPRHDLVLIHDPDLLAAIRGFRERPVVWDVHEDTAAALRDRAWVPGLLAPLAARGVRAAERWADGHLHLILAEEGYRERFSGDHPVVPNVPIVPAEVPPPGDDRVVYLGRVSRGRGWEELRRVGERLREHGVRLEVLGPADEDVEAEVRDAHEAGCLVWRGFVPNDDALQQLQGALAGLSLLHDEPNYRHSMPTKVLEYLAAGIPAISTPLPLATALLERSGGGLVVPFGDVEAVIEAVLDLRADQPRRTELAGAAHAYVAEHHNWAVDAPRFVEIIEGRAASAPGQTPPARA